MSKLRIITIFGTAILVAIVAAQSARTYDGKLHVSFCDVGQGDAILIRTPGRHKILIDGGPNNQVLKCLDNELPFWNRKLSAVILTHPHYDHFRGLIDVLHRYDVGIIGQEDLKNVSDAYTVFSQSVTQENAQVRMLQKGTKLTFNDGVRMEILGPDATFLVRENPEGVTENENPPSLIIHVTYGSFDLLLPGDSDGEDLVAYVPNPFRPDVIALPHHGSENGFTQEVAQRITPLIAIASVGKDNRYGHPHAPVLEHMKSKRTRVFRTDQHGTITMKVDGNGNFTILTKK